MKYKLLLKTPERRHSGVFIVNFEHISHLFLSSVPIVDSGQVNVSWDWECTQTIITYSKLTIKALDQGVKCV